ncbi:MAG TPA: methyl-accepting chemotaxis protein [Opitutaceae bacterium]|nr:methyl-accepting chemotaxis protein [Opitutaceae bacterium]
MPTSCAAIPSRSTESATSGENSRLEAIAQTAVRLAALGPQLAALAQALEEQARSQAGQADRAATTMEQLTAAVTTATDQLRGAAAQVGKALGTVARIADQTKIISLNASIEAVRAGASGRAFGVVAEEVKRLADDAGGTTRLIEARVGDMHASIDRVGRIVGGEAAKSGAGAETIAAVECEVQGVSRSAAVQLTSARRVHGLGDEVNALTEALLTKIGAFRFAAHRRAEEALLALVQTLAERSLERHAVERELVEWLRENPPFELAYCTDAAGRQFVDNIGRREASVTADASGRGRDWSMRPWFRQGTAAEQVASTDLYRSTATGDYCFTVVAPLRDSEGALRGVLAADVNFRRLLVDE